MRFISQRWIALGLLLLLLWCSIQVATAAETYQVVTKWGGTNAGTQDGMFNNPCGVAIDGAGNVLVADTNNNRIQKFTSAGASITKWGSFGYDAGQFYSPWDIAVDVAGNVYVADASNNRVQKFTSTGTFVTKWGTSGTGNGQFDACKGIAVDSSGYVYVTDWNNHRVQKFTSVGTFVATWGTYGTGDGQLNWPRECAVDEAGNVYVADQGNQRIQKFSSTGTFLAKWGSYGSGDGQFNNPTGIAVDGAGNVYVADWNNHRVQKFTSSGGFVTKWGTQGTGIGQFTAPKGIAVDGTGNVYVTEWDNHRVQKFALLGATTAPTVSPVKILPGAPAVPRDLNGDGKYEDVNGNGRTDFADVVLFFNQLAWIAANEPLSAFDINNNGRIDFADVVQFFNSLGGSTPTPTPTPTPTATPFNVMLTSTPPEAVIELPGELVSWNPYYTPVKIVASGIPTGVASVTFVAKDPSSDFDEKGTRQKTVSVSGGQATTTFYASWWFLAPSDYAEVAVYLNYGTDSEQELAHLQIPIRTTYPSTSLFAHPPGFGSVAKIL